MDAKKVVLREMEKTIFTLSDYTPPRTRRGEHVLKFANATGKTFLFSLFFLLLPHLSIPLPSFISLSSSRFSHLILTIILTNPHPHSPSLTLISILILSLSYSILILFYPWMVLTKPDAQEFIGMIEDLGTL